MVEWVLPKQLLPHELCKIAVQQSPWSPIPLLMPLLKFLPQWLNSVCAGTAERINKVQLMINRKMLVPFRQVSNAVISCPLIRHNTSTPEDILPDKPHKDSSIPVIHWNNKALIAPPLGPSKIPLMWNKPSFIIFSASQNRLISFDDFAWPA